MPLIIYLCEVIVVSVITLCQKRHLSLKTILTSVSDKNLDNCDNQHNDKDILSD